MSGMSCISGISGMSKIYKIPKEGSVGKSKNRKDSVIKTKPFPERLILPEGQHYQFQFRKLEYFPRT